MKKGHLDQFAVIEFPTQFLHKKSRTEMPEELRRSWESLRDDIAPRDYPSLMKRYVALDLLFDKFDDEERYVDQAQPRIAELARRAVEAPDLLGPELHWLTTVEAKRGYDFGYALGVADRSKGFLLLPTLIQAQRESLGRENESVFFLGGYFRALHHTDESSFEQVLAYGYVNLIRDPSIQVVDLIESAYFYYVR
ncbi:MAG: hypothetical protein QOE77_3334 [Blastocatellia bacterium]|nr:hypothetical protein [Blastocatellia bacterium]